MRIVEHSITLLGLIRNVVDYLQKAMSLDASYLPAHFNAAVLYMRDRRFTDACNCLDIVVNGNPKDAAALLNRAITKIFLNKPEVCKKMYMYLQYA